MPINPHDARFTVDIGSISDEFATLSVSIEIRSDGNGEILLYATGEKRSQEVLIGLDLDGYNRLRKLIKKTDETIKELSERRQLRRLQSFDT